MIDPTDAVFANEEPEVSAKIMLATIVTRPRVPRTAPSSNRQFRIRYVHPGR